LQCNSVDSYAFKLTSKPDLDFLFDN